MPRASAARDRRSSAEINTALLHDAGQPLDDGGASAAARRPSMEFLKAVRRGSAEAIFGPRDPLSRRFLAAAAHVDDAFQGLSVKDHARPWLQRIHAQLGPVRWSVTFVYLNLAWVERPAWCFRQPLCDAVSDTGAAVPLSGLPIWSTRATIGIELACIGMFAADTLLQRAYRGPTQRGSKRQFMLLFRLSMYCAIIFDLLWWSADAHAPPVQRLAPGFRPWVVVSVHPQLRKLVLLLGSLLFRVLDTFLLGLLLVLWFGLFMFVLFKQFCGPGSPCDESFYFGDIPTSFVSVQVLLTTNNFPDVMLEAFNINRLAVLPSSLLLRCDTRVDCHYSTYSRMIITMQCALFCNRLSRGRYYRLWRSCCLDCSLS